jgi:hypothetical protein
MYVCAGAYISLFFKKNPCTYILYCDIYRENARRFLFGKNRISNYIPPFFTCVKRNNNYLCPAFKIKHFLLLNVIRKKHETNYFKKVTVIEEERYSVTLNDECINAEKFSASVKLSAVEQAEVKHERHEILQAAARIILIRKKSGMKADVKSWVALLMTLFRFLNSRDACREMTPESLETELHNLIKELEECRADGSSGRHRI